MWETPQGWEMVSEVPIRIIRPRVGGHTTYVPQIRYDRPGNFGGVTLGDEPTGIGVECVTLDSQIDLLNLALIKVDPRYPLAQRAHLNHAEAT